MSMATAVVPLPERENYLNKEYGIKSWLLTTDHKRIALLYLLSITFFFFIGGFFCVVDPFGTAHTCWRPGAGGHLQQVVHHARPGNGVLLPDSSRPSCTRQFPGSNHDWG